MFKFNLDIFTIHHSALSAKVTVSFKRSFLANRDAAV